MSRKKSDYEKTFWYRLENFVNGVEPPREQYKADEARAPDAAAVNEDEFLEDWTARQRKQQEAELLRESAAWSEHKGIRIFGRVYTVLAVLLCVGIMAGLLVTVSWLPRFGAADNPANNEVSARYIESGVQETGATNVVTGLILSYRGFDTMGETCVLFLAATCVTILLFVADGKEKRDESANDRNYEPTDDIILQKVATVLVPCVFLFGIYVVLNGHLSPGGGFSGGAMLGAGLILHVSAFGFPKTQRFFQEHTYVVAKVSALCFYVASLSYYFYMGANGFENHIPLGTPGNLISSGLILLINIFVGTEVACTMYAFYALFRKGGL